MRVVIDSNRLQSEELHLFLSMSAQNRAILTDYAWMEAYKGDTLQSIIKSMAVLRDFPHQVIILLGTKKVSALDARAPGIADRMIWPRSEGEFAKTVLGLTQAEAGDQSVISRILKHGRAAEAQMATALAEAQGILSTFTDLKRIFSPAEIRACRTGAAYSMPMFEKIMITANHLCDGLFASHPQKPRRPSRKSRVNTFTFRYALAAVLYFLDWIREGGQLGKRGDRVRNDMIDLVFATYGTFFNGIMSDDSKLRSIHDELRIVLGILKARLPPDYLADFLADLRSRVASLELT